jgi:glycosyltransferase involved in cell wall biosynthesis
MKILVFIVAYNAESHIESVLNRIPAHLWDQQGHEVEVLIIDDQSKDRTTVVSQAFKVKHQKLNLTIFSNPVNQGYGGNQKLGYNYAINHRFDVVILLHGDGQYAPELLPKFIEMFSDASVDAVFGSRMLTKGAALRGGMPLYKFIGNRILTTCQNLLLGQHLSEFHSGYRAYRVRALKEIPFEFNSPDFDFDTDIIVQLVGAKKKIVEIPIPTYYGNEICRVNGLKYAFKVISSTIRFRLQQFSIFYHPKFDNISDSKQYTLKLNQPSSHQWAIDRCAKYKTVLDLGCGPGFLCAELRNRSCFVIGVDQCTNQVNLDYFKQANLDEPLFDFSSLPQAPQIVLCLDIIEHLKSPERFLLDLRAQLSRLAEIPEVIITTPNIAFFLTRLGLLLGLFNYGKKGILDLTHTRLFTLGSLEKMMISIGYDIIELRGVPAPIQLIFGSGIIGRSLSLLSELLARCWKKMFAYQIWIVAKPLPTMDRLLRDSRQHARALSHDAAARQTDQRSYELPGNP